MRLRLTMCPSALSAAVIFRLPNVIKTKGRRLSLKKRATAEDAERARVEVRPANLCLLASRLSLAPEDVHNAPMVYGLGYVPARARRRRKCRNCPASAMAARASGRNNANI